VIPPRLDEAYVRSPRFVGRRIGDEFVLVKIAGRGADIDAILNLTGVGGFIWEQLDGRATGNDVVKRLVERFDVEPPEAEADYLGFLADLRGVSAVDLAGATEG